ncbi:MAG: ankyrin repeat domain-containing protein [Synergistaceae bacterium]|jgi:ankyrin repeat protein|nr:ankyrin repeat domain-containing protein [Synergistaceae bacterium]
MSTKHARAIGVFAAVFAFAFFVKAGTALSSELAVLCAWGDVAAVRELLFHGANPDERDEWGYTPLMRTVRAGVTVPLSMHFRIVELLIDAGADVNACVEVLPAPSWQGRENPEKTMAPLHWAVEKGENFWEMTLLLLEKGADPNLSGALGPPLHIAAMSRKAGATLVSLLLEWGADARLTDQWGFDPLVSAVVSSNPDAGKIRLLLDANADPNATFDWEEFRGISVLIAAAVNGTPDIIQLLLDKGALKPFKSDEGLTAYDYALAAGREKNAELLK